MKRIELNAVWDDAKALGLANRELLSAIAGMFILLPAVASDQLMTPLTPVEEGASSDAMMQNLATYFTDNWLWLFVSALLSSVAALAMLTLMLRGERPTVAESIKAGFLLLPAYFAANLLQSLAVMTGLMLFLLPGFYLIARLSLIAPVTAAERLANPLSILRRSAELTSGNGWRIFALLAVLFVTAVILGTLIGQVLGVVALLVLPEDLSKLLLSVVSGLIEAVVGVVYVLVTAGLYRQAQGGTQQRELGNLFS